jgi:hypothetical protein
MIYKNDITKTYFIINNNIKTKGIKKNCLQCNAEIQHGATMQNFAVQLVAPFTFFNKIL